MQDRPTDGPDTTELYSRLFKSDGLDTFIRQNGDALHVPTFHAYITALCCARGETPGRVIQRADLENSYGYQLFSGKRNPSRDTVIQLAFGLEADVETAQTLLKYAGRSQLYPRIKRDAAILYCLHHGVTLVDAQAMLHSLGLSLIGGNDAMRC